MVPLTLDLIDFLLSPPASEALTDLAASDLSDQRTLALITSLRASFAPDQAAALLDQARLRRRAVDKFPHADQLLFTDEALQQASSRAVAAYRARQYAALSDPASDPSLRVADLGCGIGADTLALAEAGLHVLAVERDPVRARIAQINVAALGLDERVEVVERDWVEMFAGEESAQVKRTLTPTLSQGERESEPHSGPLSLRERAGVRVRAAFVDPSRRAGDRRIFSLEDMEPPLSAVLALAERVPAVAVKTMPGIADADIPANAEVEFISERGQMKEALLRFGAMRTGAARRATLLPGPYHLDSDAPLIDAPATEPSACLLEPDPAVIRATLVQHLATALGASQIDPTIAYLTADRWIDTPFARCWNVLRHGPFHLKTLNRWLREMEAGTVIVKKRGSPIDPDDFRRRLKTTPGGQPVTVFVTRSLGRPWMIVADP